MLKAVAWKTSYTIDVTIEELEKIEEAGRLYELLGAILGVSNVDYDGHFGPHIFLDVEKEDDNTDTWDKIFATIDNVIGG